MSTRYLSLDLITAGVAGLRSVTDEGDELLQALESLAAEGVLIRDRSTPVDESAALAAVARCGTIARAARELGVPRSSGRWRTRSAPSARPARRSTRRSRRTRPGPTRTIARRAA